MAGTAAKDVPTAFAEGGRHTELVQGGVTALRRAQGSYDCRLELVEGHPRLAKGRAAALPGVKSGHRLRFLVWRPLLALLLVAAFLVGATPARAETFPPPQGLVNDFAKMLSPDTRQRLEAELTALEKDTTAEVAVVTVDNLGGTTVEDYAVRLFEQWKIGKKGKDNGVLLLVAKEERKIRIEVGYGLEPIIPDGRAGRIIREEISPRFKEGDYDGGITAGITAIKGYITSGEPAPPPAPLEDNPAQLTFGDWFWLLLIVGVITVYFSGFMARSKSIWLGGIWGFLAGGFLGIVTGTLLGLLLFLAMGTGMGLTLDRVLSRTYRVRKERGHSTSWWGSWGGFSGGGRGGGGGGGFGGFGGGSSGGGGASGGW